MDREALLEDVRDRLAERLPAYKDNMNDPTDPGWLLIEQAAWMVEILTGQLDRYPFSIVRHFVRMMGAHVRPARPSVGSVVVEVAVGGVMQLDRTRPSPWRFFTPQSEATGALEFVPIEESVDLQNCSVVSMSEIVGGELFLLGIPDDDSGIGSQIAWCKEPTRSKVFDRERIHFSIITNNADDLRKSLEDGLEHYRNERDVGWLKYSFEQVATERFIVTVEIDPAGAFNKTVPGGVWEGGDLEGIWGVLDESTWTPPVRVSSHPLLPIRLRGARPMPAEAEGRLLLPGVPQNFPINELLTRRASPTPQVVVDAMWKTLANINARLGPINPSMSREFVLDEEEALTEPTWVAAALHSGIWSNISFGTPRTTAFFRFRRPLKENGNLRIGVVLDLAPDERLPEMVVFGRDLQGNMAPEPLKTKVVWQLPSPSPKSGQAMLTTVALDIGVDPNLKEVLLVVDGKPLGFQVNTILVANTLAVRDGREVRIQRNVPEGVSLLFEDVLNRKSMDYLLEEPIPSNAAAILRALPLAHFTVVGEMPITDWVGVSLDPCEGRMDVNSPDDDGVMRSFRPQTRIRLNWYLRTDGALANVNPTSIRLVEQDVGSSPTLMRVVNPLGSFFGSDRESSEAAIDRVFSPSGGTPVLPSDFERMVRLALGQRGRNWLIRCWSYAERALLTTAVWPTSELAAPSNPETLRLKRELSMAGPETLLVVLGPLDDDLRDEDLDWAHRVIRQQVKHLSQRLPTVRDVIVTRFWPLKMLIADTPEPPEAVVLPCYDVQKMHGKLVDPQGREAPPPRAMLLLNAAVTEVEVVVRREV